MGEIVDQKLGEHGEVKVSYDAGILRLEGDYVDAVGKTQLVRTVELKAVLAPIAAQPGLLGDAAKALLALIPSAGA